jgi:hypothetical protein
MSTGDKVIVAGIASYLLGLASGISWSWWWAR